jgi:hypothetical protein
MKERAPLLLAPMAAKLQGGDVRQIDLDQIVKNALGSVNWDWVKHCTRLNGWSDVAKASAGAW